MSRLAGAEQEASERERECVSRSQIYRLAPTNGPKPDEEEIKRRSAACMADPNQDRFALAALARSRKDGVITPAQVSAVTVPTLGVVGSLDGYLADFQELNKLRPDVKLVVIDGATHGGGAEPCVGPSSSPPCASSSFRIEPHRRAERTSLLTLRCT